MEKQQKDCLCLRLRRRQAISSIRKGLSGRAGMMKKISTIVFLVCIFVLIAISECKTKVHIPDDLDDIVDEEEDEQWKNWGNKKESSKEESRWNPPDFEAMSPQEIQAEMMKRHTGPSMGFVKLRLGVKRSRDDVPEIAMKWTHLLRTGAINAKFMAVDLSTIMFTMEKGQDVDELMDFILSQPEAYELKIGEQAYRRPGDPPLEAVIEMLQSKKAEEARVVPEDSAEQKDEL